MDLCLVKDRVHEKLDHYTVGGAKITGDHFELLGFMDSRAVVKTGKIRIVRTKPVKRPHSGLLPKFKVDEYGEQYIHLNGQKLKVVPQEQIPKEIRKQTMVLKHQMINIGSLNKPLQVRVISGAKPINNMDITETSTKDNSTSNHTDNSESDPRKKYKLISVKNVVKSPPDGVNHIETSDTADAVIPQLTDSDDDAVSPYSFLIGSPRVCEAPKLLTTRNLETLNKMQALNLSKKACSEFKHAAVQTSFQSKSVTVQTELQYSCNEKITDIDLFCSLFETGESPIVNDLCLSQAASSSPRKQFKRASPTSMLSEEGRMSKKLIFFKDLNECLVPTMNGNLSIHEGVLANDIGLVTRMCMALKVRGVGVNLDNGNGCTPLQIAVIMDSDPAIVRALLDNGADIQEADGEGNNILHLAAKFERLAILRVIMNHPAIDLNSQIIDNFNFDGLTPLMICCKSCWKEGAILFVSQGANVNLKDLTSGRTALFHAAEAPDEEIVRLLLDNRADPKIKNFFGTSPHDAMYELQDMPEVIKNLIFGKTKLRTIAAEMNPFQTAKAAKKLKTFSRLQKIEPTNPLIVSSIIK